MSNLHKQLEEQNKAIEDLNKLIQSKEHNEDVYSKEEKEVIYFDIISSVHAMTEYWNKFRKQCFIRENEIYKMYLISLYSMKAVVETLFRFV